ncbi:YciI family protein [Pseudorhodoplanes sp.]|uniref:YciI family protein n=1 Tax=Pseudorhodoplanes sp. TaxID=1934341 RepID=UPI003D0CCBA3
MSDQSVPAADIIALSTEKGFLAKQLYVVFTTPIDGMGPVMQNIEAHLVFQESLQQRGIMFAAGPHWSDNETSWDGDGMVVIRAGSLSEARDIAATDPMHANGARKFTVRPWLINEGTVTIKLSYAGKTFELL